VTIKLLEPPFISVAAAAEEADIFSVTIRWGFSLSLSSAHSEFDSSEPDYALGLDGKHRYIVPKLHCTKISTSRLLVGRTRLRFLPPLAQPSLLNGNMHTHRHVAISPCLQPKLMLSH
jgi:hypothetical protein